MFLQCNLGVVSFLQYISTVSQEIKKKQGLQYSESIWVPGSLLSVLVRAGRDEAIGEQTLPSVPEGGVTVLCSFFFFPVGSWHETIGKSLMPLYFFRVVSLDSLWLCCWEYETGIFWDEGCCVNAICRFCCLNLFLGTGIYAGVINRLNCPSRDSSPPHCKIHSVFLLLQHIELCYS